MPMIKRVLSCLALALGLLVCAPTHSALLINGAGSTFGYPIYSKWFYHYAKIDPNVHFNYQSIGSGGGIRMLLGHTVEIGASDAPLTEEQMKRAPGPVLHFPTVLGAVSIAYNLPGFKGELRLTGPAIADIYLGKIKQWNDPELVKLNPGVNLPDKSIVVVHRSDGSGDTYIFADYLTKISPEWAKEVGRSTALKWPVGLGGKGNEGVTALVTQTPYAIGYVTLIYALETHMPVAEVRNHDGVWIKPSLDTVTAAAAGASANMPSDFRVSITDAPGKDAYPISSFTWMIIYTHQTNREVGSAVKQFLHWMLVKGQQYAAPMNYAPLPKAVVDKELAQLKEITLPAK
jgi:phosphate transport system substrate-binding protein